MEEKKVLSVNELIASLNKIGILFFVIIYAVLLGVIVKLITGRVSYQDYYIPNYPSVPTTIYNTDLSVAFQVVHQYTYEFDDEGENAELSESIGVTSRIFRRQNREATKREYMAKVLLDNEKMFYFVQHSNNNYSVIHSHALPASNKAHIKTLFSSTEYTDKDGERKSYRFQKDILELNEKDLSNFTNELTSELVGINLSHFEQGSDYGFNFDVRVLGSNLEVNETFQVDVQSWAVTNDNKIYPFIGYYNFTNSHYDSMVDNGKLLPIALGTESIYLKVKIFTSIDDFNSINRQEEILYKYDLK